MCFWVASSPPPRPAIPADTANARIRIRVGLMPIDCAAVSLPRSAARNRPVVPLRTRITKNDDGDQDHDAQQQERAVVDEPDRARHPHRARAAAHPAERHDHRLEHERDRERAERQEDAAEPEQRHRDDRTDERGDEGADEHRREHRAARRRTRAGRSRTRRSPANVAWASEISPAMPVMTVIESRITEKITAVVKMLTQRLVERGHREDQHDPARPPGRRSASRA